MVNISEYISRLKIPIIGDNNTVFTDQFNTIIGIGYIRIVIGDRGPYIEFAPIHLIGQIMSIPDDQLWRLNSKSAYYVEYRTLKSNIKVYYQLKPVNYADYVVKMCYISPFDLYVNNELIITRKI